MYNICIYVCMCVNMYVYVYADVCKCICLIIYPPNSAHGYYCSVAIVLKILTLLNTLCSLLEKWYTNKIIIILHIQSH